MRSALFVFCLFVVCFCVGPVQAEEKQVLATLAPQLDTSQSKTVTPRPARTDFIDLSFSEDSYEYRNRFDSFGTSFFQYFGITSIYGVDDEEQVEQDDDEFIFNDDDDGGDDDGADDDDEEVVFNDVARGSNLIPSLISVAVAVICFSFAFAFSLHN